MTFGRKTSRPVSSTAVKSQNLPLIAFSGMAIVTACAAIILWPHPSAEVETPPIAPTATAPAPQTPFAPDLSPLLKYPNTRVEYYAVEADTPMEAVAYMYEHGPRGNDGFRAQGITYWKVNWNYPRTRNGCDTSRVRVTLASRVLLPRLNSMDKWTEGHKQVWARFMQALIVHEAGHVQLSSRHLFRIADAVKRSPCDKGNDAAQAILDEINAENVRFDKETQHGAKFGVDMRASR